MYVNLFFLLYVRERDLFAVRNRGVEIGSSDRSAWRRQRRAEIARGDWNCRQRICFANHCRINIATIQWLLHGLLLKRKPADFAAEKFPSVQSFARPDPEAGSDPDSEGHEVLEHQD